MADATSAADALEYFGGLAATLTGDHVPLRWRLGLHHAHPAWRLRRPRRVGTYPTQIAALEKAPRRSPCGNTMVSPSPSEQTPLCALENRGNPDRGRGAAECLQTWCRRRHRRPRACRGCAGGQGLAQRLRPDREKGLRRRPPRRLKHVTMEVGGKSPLIIFEDRRPPTAPFRRDQRQLLLLRAGLFQRHARVRATRDQETLLSARPPVWPVPPSATPADKPRMSARMTRLKIKLAIHIVLRRKSRPKGGGCAICGTRLDRPAISSRPAIFRVCTDDMAIRREELRPVMSSLGFRHPRRMVMRGQCQPTSVSPARSSTRDFTQPAHRSRVI